MFDLRIIQRMNGNKPTTKFAVNINKKKRPTKKAA